MAKTLIESDQIRGSVVFVTALGCEPDGSNDCAPIIQAAIDAGTTAFYFPDGTYNFQSEVDNDNTKGEIYFFGSENSILQTETLGQTLVRIGEAGDAWGTGGRLFLEKIKITCKDTNYTGYGSASSTNGFIEVYNSNSVRIDRVEIQGAGDCAIYVADMGYASITRCNIVGTKSYGIHFDSTAPLDAVTSTLIQSVQLGTCLGGAILLTDVWNIDIYQCQIEAGAIPLTVTGNTNRNIRFVGNYVEDTTSGAYDIDISAAQGFGFACYDNYLSGTPTSGKTINLPATPSNFAPIIWFNNTGASGTYFADTDYTDAFSNPDWFRGSRDAGSASLVGSYAHTDAQQTATIRAETENLYGAGIKGTSVNGRFYFGGLRGAAFDASDANSLGFIAFDYQNRGAINTEPTEDYALHVYGGTGASYTQNGFKVSEEGGDVLWTDSLGTTLSGTPNAAAAALKVAHPNTTGRSINASGTVNAGGLDYAEYMKKDGSFKAQKGDILGITKNGLLTNQFNQAIKFCVKSTDPAVVGGDRWSDGLSPEEAEKERHNWDRIAFCGQAPVNCGGEPGQFIIPIESIDGGITGLAVDEKDLSFSSYLSAIGQIIKLDNKPVIIVKL